MNLLALVLRSAWSRRIFLSWTVLALGVSAAFLMALERVSVRQQEASRRAMPRADLIVGPAGAPRELLFQALFHTEGGTSLLPWTASRRIAALPGVAWAVPIQLGERVGSHPVVATDSSFFASPWLGYGSAPMVLQGKPFAGLFEAVVGAEVAKASGIEVGDSLRLSHGNGEHDHRGIPTDRGAKAAVSHEAGSSSEHDGQDHHDHTEHEEGVPAVRNPQAIHSDKPFRVVGILAPTGTPVDGAVWTDLRSLSALHLDWRAGAPMRGFRIPASMVGAFDLTPPGVHALLVGLDDPTFALRLRGTIQSDSSLGAAALLPEVALADIRRRTGSVEDLLVAAAVASAVSTLLGLVAVLVAGTRSRLGELALLRASGARTAAVRRLLFLEGAVVGLVGGLLAWAIASVCLVLFQSRIETILGLSMDLARPALAEPLVALLMALSGGLASLAAGWASSRKALLDALVGGA